MRELLALAVSARSMVENEVLELAADRGQGSDDLSRFETRRLYLRLIPEIVALLAVALRDANRRQQGKIIDEFIASRVLWAQAIGDITSDLSGFLSRYCDLVSDYDGWEPLPVFRTEDNRAIQPWQRRAGHEVAADFVALRLPEFDAALGEEYASFDADCEAAYAELDGHFCGAFVGMRVITSLRGWWDLDVEAWYPASSDGALPGITVLDGGNDVSYVIRRSKP